MQAVRKNPTKRSPKLNKRHSLFLAQLEQSKCPSAIPLSRNEERFIFSIYSRFTRRVEALRAEINKTECKDKKAMLRTEGEKTKKIVLRIESIISRLNHRLVCSIVSKILKSKRISHMEFNDLVNEGNAAQLKPIRRFDPERGNRYSTYATWWIKQGVTRAVKDQERAVRLPVHVCEAISKIIRFTNNFAARNRRNPTIEEVSEGTGIKEGKIMYVLSSELRQADLISSSNNESNTLLDNVLSQHTPRVTAFDEFAQAQSVALLYTLMDSLNPREREILERRFGLNGREGKEQTLEEVGADFSITRERVRQIQLGAILKLKKVAEEKGIDALNL
jgi:RNA polymerase sigma factor (sigma-70 family)